MKQLKPNMPVSTGKKQTSSANRVVIVSDSFATQSMATKKTQGPSGKAALLKNHEFPPNAQFLDFAASSSPKSASSKAKHGIGKLKSHFIVESENARRPTVDTGLIIANDVSISTPHVGHIETMALNTPSLSVATSTARALSRGAAITAPEKSSMMHADENSTQMKKSNDLT